MKDDTPVDFVLMGFNDAFKRLVNGKAEQGMALSSLCPQSVVSYWIEQFWPIACGKSEVRLYNYVSTGYKRQFDLVVGYPAELLGQQGIAIIFFEKVPVEILSDIIEDKPGHIEKAPDNIKKQYVFAKLLESELKNCHSLQEGLAKLAVYISFFELLLPVCSQAVQEDGQLPTHIQTV